MLEWYYQKGKKQFGPVSGQELKALAAAGQLLTTDLVRKDGTSEWRPAQAAKGLFTPAHVADPGVQPAVVENASDTGRGGLMNLLTILLGLASILIGAAAIAAFFTPFAGLTISLAMGALVGGTFALLLDWIRDVPRFSISVMGVVTATIALCLAFVHQGGLDFKRYTPIIVVKTVAQTASPDRAQQEIDSAWEMPHPHATEATHAGTADNTRAIRLPSSEALIIRGGDDVKDAGGPN